MDGERYDAVIATTLGPIGIRLAADRLAAVTLLPPAARISPPRLPLACEVAQQISDYLAGLRTAFDLPLADDETPFRRRLRKELLAIPAGETRSYGEVAAAMGSSARAVGGGCRANPIPVVVPCHRVVAASGLGGYDGATAGTMLVVKRRLLALEGGGEWSGG